MNQDIRSILNALNECANECNYCASACLDEENVQMLTKCIKLNLDCAVICQLASTLTARGSEHATHVMNECVEICEACAEECEKHAHMDHCRKCAEMCRACAEVCSQRIAA